MKVNHLPTFGLKFTAAKPLTQEVLLRKKNALSNYITNNIRCGTAVASAS